MKSTKAKPEVIPAWTVTRACAGCAAKLRRTQDVREVEDSTCAGRCDWCAGYYALSLYRCRPLIDNRTRRRASGGGEREKAGGR